MSKAIAYYNEIDPNAAEWLRQLIKMGLIAPGDVDERSIEDVSPVELKPYTQCHFFAGIGVWSYALRQAGWEDDRPVWTGSCPCQPFSQAGKRAGASDERDLWWAFFWHIQQCRPNTIFGEQVASADGLAWLDIVQSDLENEGYASAAVDLCAASVGAPHIRQRLFWVGSLAHSESGGSRRVLRSVNAAKIQRSKSEKQHKDQCKPSDDASFDGGGNLGNASGERLEVSSGIGRASSEASSRESGQSAARTSLPTNGFWASAEWLPCLDGKARAVKPSLKPLVDGASSRMGRSSDTCSPIATEETAEARVMRLKGYGNAIVALLAAEFIGSFIEAIAHQ